MPRFGIGLRDRRAIANRVRAVHLVTGGDALTAHVALIDGQLVAGWRRLQEPSGTVVALEPVTRITREERRRLEGQAERLSRFLEKPVTIRDRKRVAR